MTIEIKTEQTVVVATCDGCGKSLVAPNPPHNVNFGLLRSSFGYGSRLDDIVDDKKERHLCEGCWEKALAAVGITLQT
jgi:hypothetical protein